MELDLSDVAARQPARSTSAACATSPSARPTPRRSSTRRCTTTSPACPTACCSATASTHAIRAALRTGESLALLVMDLDEFKQVNDTLGHQHGDVLLKLVAERLVGCLRDGDTVARLGGDEFGILPRGATDLAGAATVVWKIQQALEPPFLVDGHARRGRGEHRHRARPRPRRQHRRPAPPRRPRDVRRQALRQRLRAVRRRAGGDAGAPARAARRPAPLHRARRARAALPAEDRPRHAARRSASRP